MRCICSNYGCTQTFLYKIESNLYYTRFIILPVVPKRGNEWRGPTPRLMAPGQRSPKKRCSGGEPLATVRPIRPAWELNPKYSASIATSLTLRYNSPDGRVVWSVCLLSCRLGFDSESGQTNDFKIAIHSFPA